MQTLNNKKFDLLSSLFHDETVSNTLKIYLPENDLVDDYIRTVNNNGIDTIKIFYLKN